MTKIPTLVRTKEPNARCGRTRAPIMAKDMSKAVSMLTEFVSKYKDQVDTKTLVKVWCAANLAKENYNPAIRKGLKQILSNSPWSRVQIPNNERLAELNAEWSCCFC